MNPTNCSFAAIVATALFLMTANASASEKPVRTGCAPLNPEAAETVGPVCVALGADPGVELVSTKKEFWTVGRNYGLDPEVVEKEEFVRRSSEPGRAVLRELDVEMMLLVGPAAASGERRVVAIGAEGHLAAFEVRFLDGSFDEESPLQRDIAIAQVTLGLEKFRANGGWDEVLSSSHIKGMSHEEKAVARMRKTGLCFRFPDKDWHFCHSDADDMNGFVFGRKGKTFRFVSASRTFRKETHINRFPDEGFDRKRGGSPFGKNFEPFTQSGAPALVVSHETGRAALSCGEDTTDLQPLSPKKSKKLLENMSIDFDVQARSVEVRKTAGGELIWIEWVENPWGRAEPRVYIGKPPSLKRVELLHHSASGGGEVSRYALEGGAEVIIRRSGFKRESSATRSLPDPRERLPDGSMGPPGGVLLEFHWSTYRPGGDAPEEKLYGFDDAGLTKIFAAVTEPPPIANPATSGVCSAVHPAAKAKTD